MKSCLVRYKQVQFYDQTARMYFLQKKYLT